jgi:hypothetical protein
VFAADRQAAQLYLSSAARKDLLAAGVPLVDMHSLTRRERRTPFGGRKFVSDVVWVGRGWLLGDILWTANAGRPFGGDDVTEPVLTVLSESGNRYGPYRGLVRVRPDGDHGDFLALGGWAMVEDWATAATRVRTLAASKGGAQRSVKPSPRWRR